MRDPWPRDDFPKQNATLLSVNFLSYVSVETNKILVENSFSSKVDTLYMSVRFKDIVEPAIKNE